MQRGKREKKVPLSLLGSSPSWQEMLEMGKKNLGDVLELTKMITCSKLSRCNVFLIFPSKSCLISLTWLPHLQLLLLFWNRSGCRFQLNEFEGRRWSPPFLTGEYPSSVGRKTTANDCKLSSVSRWTCGVATNDPRPVWFSRNFSSSSQVDTPMSRL